MPQGVPFQRTGPVSRMPAAGAESDAKAEQQARYSALSITPSDELHASIFADAAAAAAAVAAGGAAKIGSSTQQGSLRERYSHASRFAAPAGAAAADPGSAAAAPAAMALSQIRLRPEQQQQQRTPRHRRTASIGDCSFQGVLAGGLPAQAPGLSSCRGGGGMDSAGPATDRSTHRSLANTTDREDTLHDGCDR